MTSNGEDIASRTPADDGGGPGTAEQPRQSLRSTLERVERDLILEALRLTRGNKTRAARALGITERLMRIRVKKLGIDWRALRAEWRLPPHVR